MQQKYWLAENGMVRCLGDDCPQECDMHCPIYLRTLAVPYQQNGHYEAAASYLEKALEIEPTFAEAWNNLAVCHGQMGNHQRAFDYYLKSYELLPKPNSLFGMAVAMKNLGNYTQATQYAMLYQQRYGTDDRINRVLAEISARKQEQAVGSSLTSKSVQKPVQQQETGKNDPNKETTMREYGLQSLMVLDEKSRARGYAEIEKLEPRFPEAGVALGQYYQATDPQKAKRHFKIAADAHIHEGEWGYANQFHHSYVPDKKNPDDIEYETYCLRAAEGGCPDAANEMGNICHRRACLAEAAYWYGMAFFMEHPQGLVGVNGILQKWLAVGKPEDYRAGSANYTKERHKAALCFLKIMSGTYTLDQLMTLCLAGDTLAGLAAGYFFEQGKADDMAYKAYNALAFEKHPHVLRCYADMCLAGKGTQRDVERAFRMYKLAAEGGNATAMYAMGQKAVKEGDLMMAACWFSMADSRGMELAGDWLARLKGDE